MWVLGAHMERSQAPGQDWVLIRCLFPTFEGKQGEPQARAGQILGPAFKSGGLGRASASVSDAQEDSQLL